MSNNIAFKLFVAILIVSSTAKATEDLGFEELSNPSYKMSALNRAQALLALSEKSVEFAEQCLDEIMQIAKGKYGLARKRSASTEERTVVGKAIAALKRRFSGKSNPFEVSVDIEGVDDFKSAQKKRHFSALREGFEHITELMSDETEREVEVFGILVQFSVLAPKPTVVSVREPVKPHEEEVVDDSLLSSKDAPKPQPNFSLSTGDGKSGSSEDELDMGVVMNELHKKKKDSLGESPVGTPKSSPKPRKKGSKRDDEGKAEEETDAKESGRSLGESSSTAVSSSDIVTPPNVVVDAEAQAALEKQKREEEEAAEEAERKRKADEVIPSSSGGGSGKGQALPPPAASNGQGGGEASNAAGEEEVVQNAGCCGRRRSWSLKFW
ncbi:MAG: hypothetical protein K2Q34_05055 [Alphaproteobacteria bacterium]|nr:hypothetical protein [Alphaproteobacteria bacterium]